MNLLFVSRTEPPPPPPLPPPSRDIATRSTTTEKASSRHGNTKITPTRNSRINIQSTINICGFQTSSCVWSSGVSSVVLLGQRPTNLSIGKLADVKDEAVVTVVEAVDMEIMVMDTVVEVVDTRGEVVLQKLPGEIKSWELMI
ncbi:hypothetical protein L6452_20483 [Arctium lappa]|uniref:Uncharacterized protein n=1 Tax=Arctium lappa TaxID=4217 RepID=A0ACB9BCS3_ARCLA|nr:hypothetical protein L6452_20483 [Arctium lappa]